MKKLKPLIILLILFALPAASWYFLKGGLDWRKAKVVELAPKGRFLNAYNFAVADKNRLFELMTHKTCVVKLKDDLSEMDKEIIHQFRNAHTFQFLVLSQHSEKPVAWSSKSSERYYKPQNMTPTGGKKNDSDYMLVDTSGFIRQSYVGQSKKVLTTLIEDVAVILPRKKEKTVKMKNTKEK